MKTGHKTETGYCNNCQKITNIRIVKAYIGIATIWNKYCEHCNTFIGSGFDLDKIKDD